MEKKVVRIKLEDLKKIFQVDNTADTLEENVVELFNVELNADEIDMLKRLLDIVEGEDETESAILNSVIEKLNNIESKEEND